MWHPQGSGQSTVDVVNFVKGRQEITTMNTYPLSLIRQILCIGQANDDHVNNEQSPPILHRTERLS